MLQRGAKPAAIARDGVAATDRIYGDQQIAHLGNRVENAIGEEADVWPDPAEQAGEYRSLENPEGVIGRHDCRPTVWYTGKVDVGRCEGHPQEIQKPVGNRPLLPHGAERV